MKSLSTFFREQQFSIILDWPCYSKEEATFISSTLAITSLKITKLIIEGQSISENVLKQELIPNLKGCFNFLPRDSFILPIAIILSLINERNASEEVITKISSEYFFKSANLSFIKIHNILKEYNNKDLLVDTLLLLSSLCRKSQDVYPTIDDLNIYVDLKYMLEHSDSIVKSRVCNLIGNMCRYSDFFYEELIKNNLVVPIIQCCHDPDKNTRKFACFAIGNAAFINDKLYENFRVCIPILVDLLDDVEDNTRANSAGALGNFVRCSDILCQDIISHKAHLAILNLAEREESIQTIKVALFALGNFCNHNVIKLELEKVNFKSKIDQLKQKYKSESQLSELFERIKKKLQ
jgi:fused-like protein